MCDGELFFSHPKQPRLYSVGQNKDFQKMLNDTIVNCIL